MKVSYRWGGFSFGRDDLLQRLGELDAATTLVICGHQEKPQPHLEALIMAKPWMISSIFPRKLLSPCVSMTLPCPLIQPICQLRILL